MATRPTTARIAMAFAAVYVIWGSTYLAIRFAVETIPPLTMAGLRVLIAGGVLYAWARLRGLARPTRIHWRSAAIVGGLLLLGGNGLVSWAEQKVPSGIAALIVGSTPMWMVLLEWMWHGGPKPTMGLIAGLAIGFAGLAFLISPTHNHIELTGAIALLLAAFSWASGSLYSRRVQLPASHLMATAMEMIAGGAWLLAVGGVVGEWNHFQPTHVSARSLAAFAYLVAFGSMIGFSAYVWLLQVTTTARVSTYAYVNPVVAVFLGWAFAGETVTLRTFIAAAAIIFAVIMIVMRETKEIS
jgi:drug/metabolite transporter (DMT)-like permease